MLLFLKKNLVCTPVVYLATKNLLTQREIDEVVFISRGMHGWQ